MIVDATPPHPHPPTPPQSYHEHKLKRHQHLSNTQKKVYKFLSAAIDGSASPKQETARQAHQGHGQDCTRRHLFIAVYLV